MAENQPDSRDTSNPSTSKTDRIRTLNDALRVHGQGGVIVCTRGIIELEPSTIAMIGDEVRAFDRFNEDNDPHGEHDLGCLTVCGTKVMFKIDYYDLTGTWASPDATDPNVTKRVMTIMLAEEY